MKSGSHARSRLALYAPLLMHVIPTLIIGLGFVIPQSCIAGVNPFSIGFVLTVLGFVPAYLAGIALARRGGGQSHA